MRHLMAGLVVAAMTTFFSASARADNQEVADEIARNLKTCGQLTDYKIGVKFQEGTAWLKGHVANQQQMNAALKSVFQTSGVTRVVNGLTVGKSAQSAAQTRPTEVQPIQASEEALSPDRTAMARLLERVRAGEKRASAKKASAKIATRPKATLAEGVAGSFPPHADEYIVPTEFEQESAAPTKIPLAKKGGRPIPVAYTQPMAGQAGQTPGSPIPAYVAGTGGGVAPARYDQPYLPNHSWPSYAAYPNYAGLTYPRQYSPTAWPFIGPFYPYPQVPLGWRKVTLEWDDGWWMLDFKDH